MNTDENWIIPVPTEIQDLTGKARYLGLLYPDVPGIPSYNTLFLEYVPKEYKPKQKKSLILFTPKRISKHSIRFIKSDVPGYAINLKHNIWLQDQPIHQILGFRPTHIYLTWIHHI